MYGFLLLFNSNKWTKWAPLLGTQVQNLSTIDIECDVLGHSRLNLME